MTRENPTPGEGHNAKLRKEIIAGVCRQLADLNAKKDGISAEIRTIKQKRIKGDLDMKISDFNFAMRLYDLEGDNRDELLSTIQETFDALGVGEQLDFITAAEKTTKARNPEDSEDGQAEAPAAGPVQAAA